MDTGQGATAPDEFREALTSIGECRTRPEVRIREVPGPARIAPYAVALTGEIGDGIASGRFVVLFDPVGQESWLGRFRVVTLTRVALEPEMAADELLADVAWTWLTDALEQADVQVSAAGGTVTRLSSRSFGALGERLDEVELEVRASWTPQGTALGAHLDAWIRFLCTAAGLPPDGVTPLRARRNTVGP